MMRDEGKRLKRRAFTSEFYANNQLRLGGTLALMLAYSTLNVLIAYFLQALIDAAVSGNMAALRTLVIQIGIYMFISFAVEFALFRVRNLFVERALYQYKETAFDRIIRKNIRSFTEESSSRYISTLTNDVQSIQDNYLLGTLEMGIQALHFALGLAMMLYYDWLLTLIGVGFTAIPMVLSIVLGGKLAAREMAVSAQNEGFVGMIKDLLSGFPVIKSFKAEGETARMFGAENVRLERAKRDRRNMEGIIGLIPGMMGGVAQVAVFAIGGYFVITGRIGVGIVIAFVQLMNYLINPVQRIPALLANRRAATALIDKLAVAVEQNVTEEGSVKISGIGGGIELRDVSFEYAGGEPVLRDINLMFEAGKRYAIVGGSGSGKTTLLNLLLGSYQNYGGQIIMGGAELRDVATESLYDLVSVIQQSVFVFDNTIAQNITMFKDFDAERVERAIRNAGLAALIAEKGTDYHCGENGSALSGGEKQRISIARTLLRNAPVLMMDEATSALDAKTAFEITSDILKTDGLTRIIVTHRLDEALLKQYDCIIALRVGSVAESGTFEELMGRREYFYSLYNVAAG